MRVERLVIEDGVPVLAFDLHPRLTVVGQLAAPDRSALVEALVGSLAGQPGPVHVELEDRAGRRLVVFRPAPGRQRVVDVDRACDVSDEFRVDGGRLDLLAPLGLDTASALRIVRFEADVLAERVEETPQLLAAVDQVQQWLHRQIDALGTISSTAPQRLLDDNSNLVHTLVARLAQARRVAGEGLPLFLDEPFAAVEPSIKPLLLELLGRASVSQQVVLLTDDDEVASWARLEQLTGDVALVEPLPAPAHP